MRRRSQFIGWLFIVMLLVCANAQAALTVRYFGVTGAGAADGTTFNDRAALFTGGAWSTALTGFGFNSNGMRARICAGTHSPTVALSAGLFANAPSLLNPLIIVGCDASGNELSIPSPSWTAVQPEFDDSGFPVIAFSTNIAGINLANTSWNLVKFTSSGNTTTAPISAATSVNWCSLYVSGSGNTALIGCNAINRLTNSQIVMTATAFRCGLLNTGGAIMVDNVRFRGNGTANTGSGNRHAIEQSGGAGTSFRNVCAFAFDGSAFAYTGSTASNAIVLTHCTFANCRGTLILCNNTATQTVVHIIQNCMLTGGGLTSGTGYAIDAQSAADVVVNQCRVDRNGSGNFNTFLNYPTDLPGMYTTADVDANEYVSAGTGSTADFSIKAGATSIYKKGYGVIRPPPSTVIGG
jgi:hypothetical protein